MDFEKSNIQKVVFDVDYFEEGSARYMQNKIISEFNLNTVKRIDKVIKDKTNGCYIRAESIKLDLGIISKQSCETNLTDLIEEKLDIYLSNLKRKLEVNDIPWDIEVISFTDYLYEYLFNYFKYGKVNWNLEYFSKENTIGHWLRKLAQGAPELFYQLLKLFKDKSPRIRFLNSVNLYKTPSYIREIFPEQLGEVLFQANSLLTKVFELTAKPVPIKIIGHYLLYLSSSIAHTNKHPRDIKYFSETFFNFVQSTEDSITEDILLQIIRVQNEGHPDEQTFFIKELSGLYFSSKSEATSFSIVIPPGQVNVYNTWETFKRTIEEKIPAWSKVLFQMTRKFVESTVSGFDVRDKETIEKIIRNLVLESILLADFPKDIELWATIFMEKTTKIFGDELQDMIRKFISGIQKEQDKIILPQKYVKQQLDKVVFEDAGKQVRIDLETTLRYLRFFSNIGIRGMSSYFTDPLSVFEQLLQSLKLKFPRYYKSELKKYFENIQVLDFKYVVETITDREIRKDIIEASRVYSIYEIISEEKDNLAGFLLIDILLGHIIPAPMYTKMGIGKIVQDIKSYIHIHKEDLSKVIKRLGFETKKIYLGYLKRITDEHTFITVTELMKESGLIVKEDEKKDVALDLIIKFQLGIELFLQGSMPQKQIIEFSEIIKGLIDSRNYDFAKFIITQPEGEINRIKNILSVDYQDKIDRLGKTIHDNLSIKGKSQKQDPYIEIKEGEPIYIRNSGLVILNPYLNTLFKRLGYVENKKFISDNARDKAIQTMHYLATKTTSWEEPDMVLNKILAGLSPSDIINSVDKMTQEEMDMCEGLLEAVAKNWSALKKASTDSLRGSFFIRNGKLSFELSSWKLVVERKAYDVLLDKLPWSFSTIKLPWMGFPLITEW